jgi:hypothetical protein
MSVAKRLMQKFRKGDALLVDRMQLFHGFLHKHTANFTTWKFRLQRQSEEFVMKFEF